jgi:mono/diheme cytochrome c family protein
MRGSIVIALAALLSGSDVGHDASQVKVSPTAPRRGGNPEARKLTNPVASTAASIAAGKRLYSRLCVRCHGPLGKGDGGGAGAGGQPSDFTDATWDFGSSDGEIFSVIHDGTSADMESYAEQTTDTEIWTVIVFLRSIGPKPQPRWRAEAPPYDVRCT